MLLLLAASIAAAEASAASAPTAHVSRVGSILAQGPPPGWDERHQSRRRLAELADEVGEEDAASKPRGSDQSTRRIAQYSCTGSDKKFSDSGSETGRCLANMVKKQWSMYPENFKDELGDYVLSDNRMYTCPISEQRIFIGNGIPDHSVKPINEAGVCETFRKITMPLNPAVGINREVGVFGPQAIALNGVVIYGPTEATGGNAVEPDSGGVPDAKFWYGHAGGQGSMHYHSPHAGGGAPTSEALIGYALDGFPIYGPVENPDDVLDECNGRLDDDGKYRYHVREASDVDETSAYCLDKDHSAIVNWKYIIGCYKGPVDDTIVETWNAIIDPEADLPDDCELEYKSDMTPPPPTPDAGATPAKRPNFIIIQPDDMPHYSPWTPPPIPVNDNYYPEGYTFPKSGLPNIEQLRLQGVEMTAAHAASPMCGTSRYSTLTGRYPSRSASGRRSDRTSDTVDVTIPNTKLKDIVGSNKMADALDCTEDNLQAALGADGYRTGMAGKWHLARIKGEYEYDKGVEEVMGCGFDYVDGMYLENLGDGFTEGKFSHNMEWVTDSAITFLQGRYDMSASGKSVDDPFLLYFNPTVPHSSGDVSDAIKDVSCRLTADVNNTLERDPIIRGMTLDLKYTKDDGTTTEVSSGSCEEYRDSILTRAGNSDDKALGAIWLDDSIGALMRALEEAGELDNTVIIFQMDHGMYDKGSLYEGGNRIAQFVHYPDGFGIDGRQFEGLVSTIDIAPTLLDYAGLANNHYGLDGSSWKDAVTSTSEEEKAEWRDERCLFFEANRDHAVRCGQCDKMMMLETDGVDASFGTREYGVAKGLAADDLNYFNLCDGSGDYVTYRDNAVTHEATNQINDASTEKVDFLLAALDCHRARTSPKDGKDPDYVVSCQEDALLATA